MSPGPPASGVSTTVIEFLQEEIVKYCWEEDSERPRREKLESVGYSIGYKLMQRIPDRPAGDGQISIMKFICKDFWRRCYGRDMDKMKTDHKGKFDITDQHFRPFTRLSGGKEALDFATRYLYLPAGIVKGALANAGFSAEVRFDPRGALSPDGVTFSITFVERNDARS